MTFKPEPLPYKGKRRTKSEELRWASTPPVGATLTRLTTVTSLSSSGYTTSVLLEWEKPPRSLSWADRKVSHEMSAVASHFWSERPSPAAVLRAISWAVWDMCTSPAAAQLPGQEPLPGLEDYVLRP